MSKNLTRKGIAFGAMVALGTSLFAGAPAQAAGEVTLEVSAGTGNATILGETFTVKASLGALVPSSSNAKLKFAVTNASSAALTYAVDNGETGSTTNSIKVDGTGSSTTGASSAAADVVYDSAGTAGSVHTLGISTSATDATAVTVIAFLDSDNGDDLDSGEFQSAAVAINFVKAADAGLTTTWSAQVGDSTVKASVKSTVVNVAQIANSHIGVQFGQYVNGTKTAITDAGDTYGTLTAVNGAAASLNTDKNAHEASDSSITASLAAGNYVAQAVWNKGSGDFVKVGSEVAFTLAAATADATNSAYEIVATENATSAGVVRKDFKGDVVYSVTIKDADKKALAGKTVRLTTTSSLTGTFKVNGVTAATSTGYDATTDAAGVAKFVITSSTAAASDAFNVATIKSEGVSLASGTIADLAWTAASYTAVEKSGVFASADLKRGVDGTSTTLEFVLVDQWKKALSSADYRVKATLSTRTVAVLTDTLADGSASFTINDGALTTGQTTVALALEELSSGTWGSASTITASMSNRTYYWYSQTDAVTLNADGTSSADLSASYALNKTVAVDTRLSNTAKTVLTASNPDEQVTITGTVSNATTLAAKEGAKVTVSGDSSILFNVGDAYAFGSLTFFDADGTLAINAYSNKVQTDTVVTVTSNGVAKTVKVSFTGPTAASVVSAVNVSAPQYLTPGASARVTFTAVDEFGNTVKMSSDNTVAVTTTGAGYLVSTPTTSTDGVVSLTLITSPSDTGVVTIKVVSSLTSSTTDDITSTATINLGSAPVAGATARIVGSTKRFFVGVEGNTLGRNVVVKVAGKTFKTLKGSTAKKSYAVAAPKGSHKVTVFVGGKLVATRTISVK
jgi:hypothetical protein